MSNAGTSDGSVSRRNKAVPLTTSASTLARRRRGSRNGPAGSSMPLPKPRSPSIDRDFDVARERVVLQAVVADDDIAFGMRREQGMCGSGALGADPHRTGATAREQHRFVTDHAWIAVDRGTLRPAGTAAVAAADYARVIAAFTQQLGEPDHERSFAGAADADIADHDYRHRHACHRQHAGTVEQTAQRSECSEQQA